VFGRQDGQGLEVEDRFVVVGVGQRPAHLGGQGLASAAFEFRGCVGGTVDEKFQTTFEE